MNELLGMLAGGDLRSDGMANEVADIVLNNVELFDDLCEGLEVEDDVVRGRTADAVEKIARIRPELLVNQLPELIAISKSDSVPMVRWHVAMILGYLAIYEDLVGEIFTALVELMNDRSMFVKSWAIVSLCILGRRYPEMTDDVVGTVAPFQWDSSIAVRTKVKKALNLLTDDSVPFPPGWVKSELQF